MILTSACKKSGQTGWPLLIFYFFFGSTGTEALGFLPDGITGSISGGVDFGVAFFALAATFTGLSSASGSSFGVSLVSPASEISLSLAMPASSFSTLTCTVPPFFKRPNSKNWHTTVYENGVRRFVTTGCRDKRAAEEADGHNPAGVAMMGCEGHHAHQRNDAHQQADAVRDHADGFLGGRLWMGLHTVFESHHWLPAPFTRILIA